MVRVRQQRAFQRRWHTDRRLGLPQVFRKRIEAGFGWPKTVGGLRWTKLIGRAKLSAQRVPGFSVHNLIRLGSLSGGGARFACIRANYTQKPPRGVNALLKSLQTCRDQGI